MASGISATGVPPGEEPSPLEPFQTVPRSCPLCGDGNGDTPRSRYSLDPWSVKTCRLCRFTYITSAPDPAALFEEMSWEKTSRRESERRQTTRGYQQTMSRRTRWRLHLLPRKTMPALLQRYAAAGNVVDLGCGDGVQMKGLADAFVPYGIEISRAAAAAANTRFALRGGRGVNAPSLDGLRQFPAEFFAAASLRSYLEHELKPLEVLVELQRTLRPGGIAIVKVPNFACLNRRVTGGRWCGFRQPDHLNYFTPASLRAMGRKAGLSTWFGAGWRLPISDNMWALLRK